MSQQKPRQRGGRVPDKATPEQGMCVLSSWGLRFVQCFSAV